MKPLEFLLDFLLHALRTDPQIGTKLLDLVNDWSKTAKVPSTELIKLKESITAKVASVDQSVDRAIAEQFKDPNNG
jgi:hypothetical protein